MNIVIANGPRTLDNGKEVILFPSRWDSGVPGVAPFQFYPYELAVLSTLLKRELKGHTVKMLDGNLEGWDGDTYIQRIADLKPDVLICELSALTYPTMTRVMRAIKTRFPYLAITSILCGPMAAMERDEGWGAYEQRWDKAVTGEYELKVLELLGGTVPPEARTEAGLINLDWLPWPEDEDVDRTRYREINHYIDYDSDDAIIQMYPTRGCPLSCSFCVVPLYYGGHGKTSRSHRCRDVGDVCDEIEYLAAKYPNFRGIYANEEAHNANVEWITAFCHELIKRGLNKYQIDAMTGAWTYTRELVKLMSEAGYKQIRFGVESTSEQVGKAIKKTVHRNVIENLLGWCKEFGIKTYITIQIGAMGSTEQSDLATIEDVREWLRRGMIQKCQISTSCPQPGTPFYHLVKTNGWLLTEDIEYFDGYRAIVDFPDYPAARIQAVRDGIRL